MNMRYNYSFLLLLLLTYVSVVAITSRIKKAYQNSNNYYVKVLLCENKIADRTGKNDTSKKTEWEITSDNGFFISDGTKESKVFYCKSNKVTIMTKNSHMFVNNKKYLKKSIKIVPKYGDLCFDGNYYQGDFIILLQDSNLQLINKLDLEDYVFAVLRSESWPGWPLEVNKVFAVAIRTYVARRAKEAKKTKRIYHIRNNNSHQTYKGYRFMKRNDALLRAAVEKTKGFVLVYEDEIIDPLYDSCCGSVVTKNIENNMNFEKEPYLARKEPCYYCKKCSLYNWKVNYTLADLEKLLRNSCPHIKKIRSIWISKKDQAGLVKEVTIKCAHKTFKISGEKLYGLLKEVKSFCFSVKKTGKTIALTGRGYGHHIGLCQWGARQMVRELFDYKQILQFYYPGTSFVRIS